MEPINLYSITQLLAAFSASVILLLVIGQRLVKGWKEANTESSVMTMMHNELERMSEHNTKLATELSKLQLEVVTLNQELRKLTIENQQLHAEVTVLTGEVSRLQALLSTKGLKDGRTS